MLLEVGVWDCSPVLQTDTPTSCNNSATTTYCISSPASTPKHSNPHNPTSFPSLALEKPLPRYPYQVYCTRYTYITSIAPIHLSSQRRISELVHRLNSLPTRPDHLNIPFRTSLSPYESAHTDSIQQPDTKVTRTQWLDFSSLEISNLICKEVLNSFPLYLLQVGKTGCQACFRFVLWHEHFFLNSFYPCIHSGFPSIGELG